MNIIWLIVFLALPTLLIIGAKRVRALRALGPVLLCYLTGMLIGNVGIVPEGFRAWQSTASDVTVALALPLLLFSLRVREWFRIAGEALLSMLGAILSIAIVSLALFLAFRGIYPDAWKLAGMSAAVYTGGTPNIAAIKSALDVPNATYILFNTYDTVISLVYIFFMVSVGQRLFGSYLRPFDKKERELVAGGASGDAGEGIESYSGILKPESLPGLAAGVGISLAIVGLSLLLGSLVPASMSTATTILLITSLGIAASFVPAIRDIKHTFQAGMYSIYVFCLLVASMTDLRRLVNVDWAVLAFVFIAIVGSMFLHSLFCRVFKIDADTFIITSVSAICSPPFVPVVANGLKNRAVLISGITTGIVGYAIGNYLGIGVAYLFRALWP